MNINPAGLYNAEAFHKGDRIRKLRELAGYADIKSFAEATGLNRGSIAKYETTGDVPRASALKVIAFATSGRIEWIETGMGPMFNSNGDGPEDQTTD